MKLNAHLSKLVDKFHLQIDLEVADELVVLFGPSGSGKSLFLRLLAGLLTPDDGTVRVGERVLFDRQSGTNQPPQTRRMGYVLQNPALFPHWTVLENIRYGAGEFSRKARHEMAMELMHTFKIEQHKDKHPQQISGGEQQRTALARAIIRKPDVLLLDEPFSALDTPTRVEVGEYVRNIFTKLKIPVLLVTHDIWEASCLADRMAVIVGGRILQQGVPDEILSHPVSEEIARLVRLRGRP